MHGSTFGLRELIRVAENFFGNVFLKSFFSDFEKGNYIEGKVQPLFFNSAWFLSKEHKHWKKTFRCFWFISKLEFQFFCQSNGSGSNV